MEGDMETGQLNSPIPKQFVLCFDGTGNKFAGDESDSNVLKIFRVSGSSPPVPPYRILENREI